MKRQSISMRRNACIYARVSTVEQEKEGFSIPAQLKMLREYASKQGFRVIKEFVESETARRTGRTGFNEMLDYLKTNKECRSILVEKTDRLTRNFQDYIALGITHTDREVHLVREGKVLSRSSSPSDFFMQNIQVSMAAYISHNISAEAKKGMKAKAEAGLYPSVAPLGYKNTANANGVKIIVRDTKTAPLVEMIFNKYSLGGMAIKEIASNLYENGLRTKRGKRLSNSTIHRMLRNPIYRGKFLWKGIEYQGKHEPLVTSALWFSVQDMLGERSVEKPRQTIEFAYTSLMKCGHCGCTITAERKKSKYTYYHCTGFKGKHGEPNMREEKLTEQFSGALKSLFVDNEIADWLLTTLEATTYDKRQTLLEIRERMLLRREKLRKQSELLYDDRLESRISTSRYDEREAGNRRELELVEEKLDSLDSDTLKDPLEYAKGIIELAQNAHSLFVKAQSVEKKLFLKSILSNCTLRESKISPVFSQPYAILADTNAKWRASGAVSSDLSAVHSLWHPEQDSNLD